MVKEIGKTARLFKLAKDKKKELKKELSVVQENLDSLEQSLYDQMEYADLLNIKTEDGTFSRKDRLFCSCPPEDREEFHEYLKKTGDEDMIYETINANRLASWVKECIQGGSYIPDYLNVNTKHQISATKR